jgi:methionyl-tRNA synthetase
VELYNSRFANGYGNLIARTLHLIDTRGSNTSNEGSVPFRKLINKQIERVKEFWRDYKIREALLLTNEIVDEGNRYFNDSKPWETQNRNYHDELSDIYYLLQNVTELYRPVIPHRYDEIKRCLEEKKKVVLFPRIEIKETEKIQS